MRKITYSQVGDNYDTKDPVKKLAQKFAFQTSVNLKNHSFTEVSDTRGESAFVWKQRDVYMASVVEGLGTKNLIADEMRKVTGKTYYDIVAFDTVATIINDLTTAGAQPLVVHAYWAIEDNSWLSDKKRMEDLIEGWKKACDTANATWGGGETPTLKGIITKNTIELGGSAVGIIKSKKRLLIDKKLKAGDRILLLKSTGINENGVSLVRAIASRLPKGYATKLKNGRYFGEEVLNKTNIYARLVQDLLDFKIEVHYIVNITGHGLRKIMRGRQEYTYVIDKIIEPSELYDFIQNQAELSDYEMYQTFNMGLDYAIFLPEKEIIKAQKIIKKNGFESINAGYVEEGERQVVIKPKNIIFKSDTLDLR